MPLHVMYSKVLMGHFGGPASFYFILMIQSQETSIKPVASVLGKSI